MDFCGCCGCDGAVFGRQKLDALIVCGHCKVDFLKLSRLGAEYRAQAAPEGPQVAELAPEPKPE